MKHLFRLLFALALVVSFITPLYSQPGVELAGAVAALLDYPAPPPPTIREVAEAVAAEKRWSNRTGADFPEPSEDAPAKVVIDYWDNQRSIGVGEGAPDKSRELLLRAVLEDPRFHARVLDLLPDTPQTHARIKQFIEQEAPEAIQHNYYTQDAKNDLVTWLSRHSGYYRETLISQASQLTENLGTLTGSEDLAALARLDWRSAKPIAERYVNSGSPLLVSNALSLLYSHSEQAEETESLRERLKSLTADNGLPARARQFASEALMQDDWPGRDEWFISMLAQSSPSDTEYSSDLDYLAKPVKQDPDRWIPILTGLVGDENRNLHNAAVFCLAELGWSEARADALRPLLPWLSAPGWASAGDKYTRRRVIDAIAKVDLPEALPGLLAMMNNEQDPERFDAARGLAKLRDPRAVPILRRAIETISHDYWSSQLLVEALIACGGVTDAEMVRAVETLSAEGDMQVYRLLGGSYAVLGRPVSTQGTIGNVLVRSDLLSESAKSSIVSRAQQLRRSQPKTARNLWLIAMKWDIPAVDVAIAERISNETADLDTLLVALDRRESLQSNAGSILQLMLARAGYARGVAAVLLGYSAIQKLILDGKDMDAAVALLASARTVRENLPIERVGSLLSQQDKRLRLAAERYLESVDTREARKLLQARRPGEILIQGSRYVFDPKARYSEDWAAWEDKLREDVRGKRADEVFGVLEYYYSDSSPFKTHSSAEISVRGDEAEFCKHRDVAREECRSLTSNELIALRQLFDEVSFDDLPPVVLRGDGFGGTAQEFVRITANGGRRVFAANLDRLRYNSGWSLKNRTPHQRLDAFFSELQKTGDFELRYELKKKISGLEVLLADDEHPVKYVAGEGGELRVLVKDKDRDWEATRKRAKDDSLNWHVLADGEIGSVADQPRTSEILDNQADLPESIRRPGNIESPLWQMKAGDDLVRLAGWNGQRGLWRCHEGREPILIASGYYTHFVVTPDARWVVAVKSEKDTASIVSINLQSGAETKFETDNVYHPISLVPGSDKVLFVRNRGDKPAYFLLDPATGAIEPATGEFSPLESQHTRPLQRISGFSDYWAAVPDGKSNRTLVGRYDARSFKFTSVLELPGIVFTSANMWIDESANRLYIAYNGHLLRLPFPRYNK